MGEVGYGSQEHMQHMWERMLEDECWNFKGTRVKWSRWGSLFDIGDKYMQFWFRSLPVMLTLAWRKQWWKSLGSCPVFDLSREDNAIAGLVTLVAESSGGTAPPRTVKDAERVQENLRGKHKNAFHLCCSIQSTESNIVSYRLFKIVPQLGGVARHLMGRSIKVIEKGAPEGLNVYLSWAAGEQNAWFRDILAKTLCSSSLAECGFEYEDTTSWVETPEILVQEEDEMASRFMTLTRQLVGHLGLSALDYSGNLPHLFLLLLHPDPVKQRQGVDRIREMWEAVQHVELPTSHQFMHNFARSLIWPSLTSVRSLCLSLEEQAWKPSEDVQRLVTLAYSTPLQTKIVEDGFNVIQDHVRISKSRAVEKMNMLHTLLDSRLFKTYGCSSTLGDVVHDDVPAKLPRSLWTHDASQFSVGGKKRLNELSSNAGWAVMSPQGAAQIPLAVAGMVHSSKGNWPGLFSLWWAMLAQPGSVLLKDKDTCYYVLLHSPYAVLGWPVVPKKLKCRDGVFSFYQFDLSQAASIKVIVINKPTAYKVATVKVRSPLYLLQKGFSKEESKIYLEHVTIYSFVEAAAREGFRGMTAVQLKQLWQGLPQKPQGKMPSTLAELGPALVRHCCEDLSEVAAKACWKKRDGHNITPFHSLLDQGENDECCKDLVEPEELQAIRETKKRKSRESVAVAVAVPQQSAGSGAASSGASSSSRKTQGVSIDWENIEISTLRKYWPAQAQCGMTREFTHATRWKAVYPTVCPPRSFSMVYRSAEAEKRSVISCLEWLWKAHKDATGTECPWEWHG